MKPLALNDYLFMLASRRHRLLLAGLFVLLAGCGGGDTPTPEPTAGAATITASTVLLDGKQFGQVESITVDPNGNTQIKTVPLSALSQEFVVGNVILLPPGISTSFPLGLTGKIDSSTATNDGSNVATLSRATFSDVVQKSHYRAELIALNSSNFIGIIAPNSVRTAAARSNTLQFTGSTSKLQRKGNIRPLEGIGVVNSDEIQIDLKIKLSNMGLNPARFRPYGSAAEAGVEIKGSLKNLQLTENHDFEKTALVPTGIRSIDLRLTGDVNLDVKVYGGVEAEFGYFSQAWKEVEDEHFRLLGISAKLTGLDSKDKIGKYPVAGLVFSVECPPLGCPVIYGTTQTPLRQAKAGGLIVWIYFDANGKIALDGEVGARINPARLTLGMAKPSGGQLDGIFELTNNTVRRLIEAPYFNGAAVLSLSLGTSIDVDFFALGVRLGNVSTDIGYRAQTTVESSTAVGWGTAKLGEPWSWDGSVCIKTSFGAGVVLSSALEIGTEIDTPWKNNVVGLGYSYSNQWPSEQEMLLLGWHNFLALSIWFTFVGDDSCSFTYTYTGNTFDTFATPSSYTTSDRVTARLTLAGALPPKLKSVDVTGLPGFSLTVSDGHQTLPNANSARAEARISTDSTGKIAGPWSMKIDGETSPAEPSIGSFNSPTNTSDHGAGHIVRGYRDIGYNVLRPGTWAKEVASAP